MTATLITFTPPRVTAYTATPSGNITDHLHAMTFTPDDAAYVLRRLADHAAALDALGHRAAALRVHGQQADLWAALDAARQAKAI